MFSLISIGLRVSLRCPNVNCGSAAVALSENNWNFYNLCIYFYLCVSLNVFLRTVEKLQQGDKKYIACQILSLSLLDVHDHDSPRWTETPTLGLICINCAQFRLGAMPIKQWRSYPEMMHEPLVAASKVQQILTLKELYWSFPLSTFCVMEKCICKWVRSLMYLHSAQNCICMYVVIFAPYEGGVWMAPRGSGRVAHSNWS